MPCGVFDARVFSARRLTTSVCVLRADNACVRACSDASCCGAVFDDEEDRVFLPHIRQQALIALGEAKVRPDPRNPRAEALNPQPLKPQP